MGDPQENHVIFQLIHGLMTWMIWGYIYIHIYLEKYSEYEIVWGNILITELDFYRTYCDYRVGFLYLGLILWNGKYRMIWWFKTMWCWDGGWWICGDGQQDLRRTCCFVLRICTGPNSVTVWFQVLLGNPSYRKAGYKWCFSWFSYRVSNFCQTNGALQMFWRVNSTSTSMYFS
jgi:hypothetical protein